MNVTPTNVTAVNLTIDRLVLRGLDPAQRTAFVQGLRSELTRVLADPANRAGFGVSRRTPVLRLGRTTLQPGISGARSLGQTVARAIGNGAASHGAAKGVRR
jgi:hypothetical protein